MADGSWMADPTGRHELRFWDGEQWTEHVSDHGVQSVDHDLTLPRPDAAPAAPPSGQRAATSTYMIREEGKNGTVEIFPDRIVRTRKKTIGKDDVQTFPMKSITAVSHDRKTLGTDEVKLQVGSVSYEWKVRNAEAMVAEIHGHMY